MLRVVNDNKLGSHIVYERAKKPPFNLDFPAHKVKTFKIKVPYVPKFNYEPPAYNPGEKPNINNSFTNNWQKITTKLEPTTDLSAFDNLFRL